MNSDSTESHDKFVIRAFLASDEAFFDRSLRETYVASYGREPDTATTESLRARRETTLTGAEGEIHILGDSAEAVGLVWWIPRGPTAWILHLYVTSELRQEGLGRRLLMHVVSQARAAGLNEIAGAVADDNASMKQLLLKQGAQLTRPVTSDGAVWRNFSIAARPASHDNP